MIKASELRLGNWVYDTSGHPAKVRHLNIEKQPLAEPILLTAEILVAARARKDGYEFILRIGALKMKLRYNTEWYCELGEIYLGSKIQYIHQLQNLYHSLTDEELQIKL